jgi:hypothetical protein
VEKAKGILQEYRSSGVAGVQEFTSYRRQMSIPATIIASYSLLRGKG